MSTLPWHPFYPERYIADTLSFSAAECGAYSLLMSVYWREGGLPADEDDIRRITRLSPKEWRGSRKTIASRFTPDWRHERLDAEREKSEAAHARMSEGGRRGGQARGASLQVVGYDEACIEAGSRVA